MTGPQSDERSTTSRQLRESGVIPVEPGEQPVAWNGPVRRSAAQTPSYAVAAPAVGGPKPQPQPRASRPHWQLRLVLLVFLLGGITYFIRPSVPWIDARLTGVEAGFRGVAERYGLSTPAPPPAVTTPAGGGLAAAQPSYLAPVVAGNAASNGRPPTNRPEFTQLPPRVETPAAAAKPGVPADRAMPGRRFGGLGPQRRGPGSSRMRGPAARRAAAARAAAAPGGRQRRTFAEPVVTLGEGDGAPSRPEPPPAVETRPPAAPPAEPPQERRSAVREAMGSGDELDRLMATAVVEGRPTTQRGRVARPAASERKLGDPEVRMRPEGRLQPAQAVVKEPPRPPLGRSEITLVMKEVQQKMNDCYRRHGQEGAAEVRVQVTPAGSVVGTLVRGELANTPTAGCVESKLKAAVFPASGGITFTYRLLVK